MTDSGIIRILLVDDNPSNLLALEAILRLPGYAVATACSATDALIILRDTSEPVDLMLLDVSMPGMDGFELARLMHLDERLGQIPIIFVTAVATDVECISTAYEVGGVEYLVKPLDIQTVRNKVAVFANQVRLRRDIEARGKASRQALEEDFSRRVQSLNKASTERHTKLLEGIDHVIEWSADVGTWQINFISGQASDILGYSKEVLAAPNFFADHIPDSNDTQLVLATFRAAVKTGQDHDCDHRLLAASGEIKWFHTGVVVHTPDLGAPMLHGVSVDITRVKKAAGHQQLLAEVTAHAADRRGCRNTLLSLASLLVPRMGDWCLLDEVSAPLTVSQAGAAHVDPAKQIILHALAQPRELRPCRTGDLAHVLCSKKSMLHSRIEDPGWLADALGLSSQTAIQTMGALSCMFVPLMSRGETLGIATFVTSDSKRFFNQQDLIDAEDVCRRVALVMDNASLFQALEGVKESRERLLAAVTHDLRNPLTAIQTMSNLIERKAKGQDDASERVRSLANKISKLSDHMNSLIENLMDFSRVVANQVTPEPTAASLKTLLEDAGEMASAIAADKRILVETECPVDVVVNWDRTDMLRVLANLTGNAVKFTDAGGHIWIRARRVEGEILVWVEDSGQGIPANELTDIFKCFWRNEKIGGGGLGLGLTIAKSLVESHQGRIWAESQEGTGTTFMFSIPINPFVAPSIVPPVAAASPLHGVKLA